MRVSSGGDSWTRTNVRMLNRHDCPPGRSLVSHEKAADEISATGGRRRLSPIDVNDVLSLCSMFAAKPQDLVVLDRENLSNSTRVGWLDR